MVPLARFPTLQLPVQGKRGHLEQLVEDVSDLSVYAGEERELQAHAKRLEAQRSSVEKAGGVVAGPPRAHTSRPLFLTFWVFGV